MAVVGQPFGSDRWQTPGVIVTWAAPVRFWMLPGVDSKALSSGSDSVQSMNVGKNLVRATVKNVVIYGIFGSHRSVMPARGFQFGLPR
jgi:hypothetical protein